MQSVGVALCEGYDYQRVEEVLHHLIDTTSQINDKLYPGAKVFIKANLARPDTPDKAVTCHPSVVKAIVTYFQSKGCTVTIGDSPGAPHGFSKKTLDTVYRATGMMQIAAETQCELNYDVSSVKVYNKKNVRMKDIQVISAITNADFIISAAKLKTHAMMRFTGAVKNLFGVIPGRLKMQYHLEMSKYIHFAQTLVDICEYVNPALSIIDGIVGMEGNGPSAGDCCQSNLLLVSDNPYELDAIAAKIIGINPEDITVLKEAMNRDLLTKKIKEIPIKGLDLDKINLRPFKAPDFSNLNQEIIALPEFNSDLCSLCGQCVRSCPPRALYIEENRIKFKSDKCIRCYCCQELCPNSAIEIEKYQRNVIF